LPLNSKFEMNLRVHIITIIEYAYVLKLYHLHAIKITKPNFKNTAETNILFQHFVRIIFNLFRLVSNFNKL
jgi:hypothetical protein